MSLWSDHDPEPTGSPASTLASYSIPMRAAMVAMLYDQLVATPRGYVASRARKNPTTPAFPASAINALAKRGIIMLGFSAGRPRYRLTYRGRWKALTALTYSVAAAAR